MTGTYAVVTRLDCFDQLAAKVKALHSYDIPELVALPIERGSAEYLGWMGQVGNREVGRVIPHLKLLGG